MRRNARFGVPYNSEMKLLAGLLVAGALTGTVAPNVSREQAAAFQKKLDGIIQHSEAATETARQTDISEGEVNRTSISAPVTRFRSGSPNLQSPFRPKAGSRPRVVDLDLVRRKKGSGSWFDPLQLSDRAPAAHSQRRAANSRRPRPVHARKRRDQRHSDSQDVSAGDRVVLLAHAGLPERRQNRRSV